MRANTMKRMVNYFGLQCLILRAMEHVHDSESETVQSQVHTSDIIGDIFGAIGVDVEGQRKQRKQAGQAICTELWRAKAMQAEKLSLWRSDPSDIVGEAICRELRDEVRMIATALEIVGWT